MIIQSTIIIRSTYSSYLKFILSARSLTVTLEYLQKMSTKHTRSLKNNRRSISLGSGVTSSVRKYVLTDGLSVAVKSCKRYEKDESFTKKYNLVTECAILKYCKDHIPTLPGFLSNGIIDYFHLGYHELTMPVADGTLLDCFDHSIAKKVSYSRQLITTVGLLHEYGIIHRDIKPENILRFRDEIKLADFGAATYFAHSELLYKDRETTPLGYRSPELLFDYVGSYGPEIDSWSLGVVLWELFVGRDMIKPEQNLSLYDKDQREIIIACSLLRMYESPLKEWPEIIFTSQWSIYAPYFDILNDERTAGVSETYGDEWRRLLRGCPLIDEITRLLRWDPTERPWGSSLIHLCHSLYISTPNMSERPYPLAIKFTNREDVIEKLVAVCSLWNYATTTILRSITYYDMYISKVIIAGQLDTKLVYDSRVVAAVALSIAADQHEIVNHPYKGYVAAFNLRYMTTEDFSRMVKNFLKTLDYDLVISNAYFEAENLMINGLSHPHLQERIIAAYVRGDCFKYSIRDLARNIIKESTTPIISNACDELSEALLREAMEDFVVSDVKQPLERVISR